jgi:phospholipase/carboxylesterase
MPNKKSTSGLFPETTAFFRGLFHMPPPPLRTVRELRRAIAAAGLRHDDCVERSELERWYDDAIIIKRDAPADTEIELALVTAGAAVLAVIDGVRCLCVGSVTPELVVVIYHGYGAHGVEFAQLAALLCERVLPRRLQIVLPQCPKGRSWFDLDVTKYLYAQMVGDAAKARVVRATPKGVPEMRRQQQRFLAAVCRWAHIRFSQLCLAGFSQGAMVAVDVALDAPETCAGVVALSGFVMCVEDWARKCQRHQGLRVLQLHGLEDRTIPYYTAPWLRDLLATNGASVTFLPHAGGHESGPTNPILGFIAGLLPGRCH